MEVIIYKDNVEKLRPVMTLWRQEARIEQFGISFDWETYIKDLQHLANDENSDLLVLMDNEPIGYMGIQCFNSPLGEQKIANEHYWYVCPEKRGMGSMRLFRAAKNWATQKGCTHLVMNASMMASSLHDKVCMLYERVGMRKFETSYIAEV